MNQTCFWRFFWFYLCFHLGSGSLHAEIDNLQELLLQPYQTPLRWDNIENEPEWVSGKKPFYSPHLKMHIVQLRPGQFIKIRIDKGSRLRILNPCRSFAKDELKVDTSNGSGLYAEVNLLKSQDEKSLLSPLAWYQPQLFIVSRPKTKKESITIALYRSRYERLPELAPYRHPIPLSSMPVQMGRGLDGGSQKFWTFNPGVKYQVTVKGPTRIAFENRFLYPTSENRLLQTYALNTYLDGKPWTALPFETAQELRWPVKVNGIVRVMGRLETGYLDIPTGCHHLLLQSTAKLYGRLLQQQTPDYLFPQLNQPKIPADLARNQLPNPPPDFWSLTPDYIKQIIHGPFLPGTKEYVAKHVMRDNTRQDGGMLGTMLMQQAGKKHMDYAKVKGVADEFMGHHTFYRNLLPAYKSQQQRLYLRWVLPRELHEFGERGQRLVVGKQFYRDMLNLIGGVYFIGLPDTGKHSNRPYYYHLPPRATPGLLRILVDPITTRPGSLFYVQFDDEKPLVMHTTCTPELSKKEYKPTQAQAALAKLTQACGAPFCGTLSGLFSQAHSPAPSLTPEAIDLPLPRKTKHVKVWKSSVTDNIAIALQYRASETFSLSEIAYWTTIAQIHAVTKPLKLFSQILHGNIKTLTPPEMRLQNHWLPLKRLILARYKQFSSHVSKADSPSEEQVGSYETLYAKIKLARFYSAHNQWLPALQLWDDISHKSKGKLRDVAQKQEINALFHLGEPFLGEQQLKTKLLYGKPAIRQWAYQKLAHLYQNQNDIDALETLAATMMYIHPSTKSTQQLLQALLKNNEPELAIMIGLTTLGSFSQAVEPLLRASYQTQWWRTYDQLLKRLKNREAYSFWKAMRFMERGEFKCAMQLLSHAGERGKKWKQQISAALNIMQAIRSPDCKTRERAIQDWAMWQAAHPGPYAWKDATHTVRDYAWQFTQYSIERDLYAPVFEGTSKRPVRLQVAGPVKVRIEVRPMHHPNAKHAIDGWLTIQDAGKRYVYPINQNQKTNSIRLYGHSMWHPGHRLYATLNLSPGIHDLKVDAGTLPFLLRVQTYEPEIRIPILPSLNVATIQAAKNGTVHQKGAANTPCLLDSCIQVIRNRPNASCTNQNHVSHLRKHRCSA